MSDPSDSDKSLLDRLNALKPTTINIDTKSNSISASSTEPTKPFSREDGLSDRLKTLRDQASSLPSVASDAGLSRSDPRSPSHNKTQPQSSTLAAGAVTGTPAQATARKSRAASPVYDSADALLDTDDQTLEELLADLGSDEQWLEEVAAEVSRSKDEEHERVTALLDELGKESLEDAASSDQRKDEAAPSDSEDESDGERMTRDTNAALAQALDEVEWEKANTPKVDPKATQPHSTINRIGRTSSSGSEDPFNLPGVPTELQDQPGITETLPEDDFEAEITSRMAALKGLSGNDRSLPSAPTSQVDELGLPVAPTFAPGDRPVQGIYKRYGYTDEDAKTWCTVCLEDGAIRCFGCDDDIYCARCWKEMHVGPSAGYEERGHRWEKFVRTR